MAEESLGSAAGLADTRDAAIQDVDVDVYAVLGQSTMLVHWPCTTDHAP